MEPGRNCGLWWGQGDLAVSWHAERTSVSNCPPRDLSTVYPLPTLLARHHVPGPLHWDALGC